MRWSPTSPHRIVDDSEGSIAKSLTSRVDLAEGLADPTRVPPVPTPMTSASGTTPSGSWESISGPSQILFSSTFHSDSNCEGQK